MKFLPVLVVALLAIPAFADPHDPAGPEAKNPTPEKVAVERHVKPRADRSYESDALLAMLKPNGIGFLIYVGVLFFLIGFAYIYVRSRHYGRLFEEAQMRLRNPPPVSRQPSTPRP